MNSGLSIRRVARPAVAAAAGALLCLAGLAGACSRRDREAAPFAPSSTEKTANVASALGTFNVLTRCYDNTQDCANLSETTITQDTAGGGGEPNHAFQVYGRAFAQPLYASSVTIGGTAHNVLYVATMNDAIYAFDVSTGTQLWTKSYVPAGYAPPNSTQTGGSCSDVSMNQTGTQGNVGIEGTPVIDGTEGVIYFVTALLPTDGGGGLHVTVGQRIDDGHRCSLGDHAQRATYPSHALRCKRRELDDALVHFHRGGPQVHSAAGCIRRGIRAGPRLERYVGICPGVHIPLYDGEPVELALLRVQANLFFRARLGPELLRVQVNYVHLGQFMLSLHHVSFWVHMEQRLLRVLQERATLLLRTHEGRRMRCVAVTARPTGRSR